MPSLKQFTLLLLSCVLAFTCDVLADDDGTWTYEAIDGVATITGCLGECPTELFLPETISGLIVTKIGYDAFQQNSLSRITIPEGIKVIGTGAFKGNQLAGVVIPDSVTAIGDNAFLGNGMERLTLGANLMTIGDNAFGSLIGLGRNYLTDVTIPDSVLEIGD